MISFRIGFASITLATPVQTPRPSAACFATVRSTPWVTAAAATFTTPPTASKTAPIAFVHTSGKTTAKSWKKCRRFWSWRRKIGERPDWECLHVPGDLCWDRLQKRPNWPLPAGANSYTFADGEGGGICPRFLARKQGFATDPFSFYGLTWCVDLLYTASFSAYDYS